MKSTFILITLLLQTKFCLTDFLYYQQRDEECGRPGYSKLSSYRPKNLRFYRTGDAVEYSCEKNNMILIGSPKRICSNGIWENRIPKCGELRF